MMKGANSRLESIVFWSILALGAVLRGVEAFQRPLQVDEALMVAEARLPIRDGLANIAADVHPPLILFLLRPFEIVHLPDFVPRLLMIAFGLASIALIYGIVRAWAGTTAALFAAACAAVMPTIVHYDTWIRMYAPLSTMELLGWYSLTTLARRSDLTASSRRAWWAIWIVSSAAAAYLHYLAWVSIAAQIIWVAVCYRRELRAALFSVAAVVVLWLPQLPTFLQQTSHGGRSWVFALAHPVSAILQIPGEALLHPESEFGLDGLRIFGLAWLLAGIAVALIWNRDSVLPWLGLAAVFTIVVSLSLHLSLYGGRYFLLLSYGVCAWTGVGLTRLWDSGKTSRLIVVGGLAALCAYTALLSSTPYYYTADWPAVAAYLQAHAQPGDALIAEQSSSFLALTHYEPLSGHRFVGVDAGGATAATAVRVAKQFPRVWLIVFEATAVDPDEDLIKGLDGQLTPLGYVRFPRESPAESVLVAEYARRGKSDPTLGR